MLFFIKDKTWRAYLGNLLGMVLVIGILLGIIFLQGCKEETITGVRFPHKIHNDMNLTCEFCHENTSKGMRMKMPNHDTCISCHNINMEKPDKECYKCHVAKDYKVTNPVPVIFKKIQFSHDKHVNKGFDCLDCHAKILNSLTIEGIHYPAMEDCLKCHQAKKATMNCQSCHPTWDRDHPPLWHSGNWKKLHGKMSQEKNMRCNVCHTQASCVKCHQVEEPDDHNQFWKKRGHALTVSWERKKCMACHKADFCQKCHENTPPSSHTAGWASNHCVTCHLPKKDTNCIVCHQNPQHSATTNVRQNLPPYAPVAPEVMQANNCMLCHYQPGNNAFPPPHPPKFPCTSCHFFN